MRNLFILAFGLLFVGCGVVRDIATDTCGNGNYNVAVCKNLLDRMVPKAPAVKGSPSTCKVEGEVVAFPSGKAFKGTFLGCSAREREEALKRLLE